MHGFKDLKVYRLAYKLAVEIFKLSKSFPKEENYALTDQIRRASRAVCSNVAEGCRKRIYPGHFVSKLTDADAEASEVLVWLDFSLDCSCISKSAHQYFYTEYEKVGRMLGGMMKHPEKFTPKE